MSVISLSRSNSSHHTYGQAPRNPALPTTRHGATRKQSFLKLALMGQGPWYLNAAAPVKAVRSQRHFLKTVAVARPSYRRNLLLFSRSEAVTHQWSMSY